MQRRLAGFTLIELMIVVAIIGILSAIAIPKFADLIRKSNEGSTKGNLGAIRSAISVYYSETEGLFPAVNASGAVGTAGTLGTILTMEEGKYIKEIPNSYCPPYHQKTLLVTIAVSSPDETANAGGWGYQPNPVGAGKPWGDLWVNCTDTDTRGYSLGSY